MTRIEIAAMILKELIARGEFQYTTGAKLVSECYSLADELLKQDNEERYARTTTAY